jgi:hypothetical protein
MKVGPYRIECVIEYRVMEGSRIKVRAPDLDSAIEWADEAWEVDRLREELQQWGDGRDGNIADTRWKLRNEAL